MLEDKLMVALVLVIYLQLQKLLLQKQNLMKSRKYILRSLLILFMCVCF